MTNRWIPLLMLAVLLATAPAAMASHCYRCGSNPSTCASITAGEGRPICLEGEGDEPCLLMGQKCFGGHAAAPPPLALVDLGLPIWLAIRMEHVVMPHHGRRARVRLLPRVPGQIRLRLAGDKAAAEAAPS